MSVHKSYSSRTGYLHFLRFIFRTLSCYVIVKTYGGILVTSLVSAPTLLPNHCISFELVNSSLVRFIPAHAAQSERQTLQF